MSILSKIANVLFGTDSYYADDGRGGYARIEKTDMDIDADGNAYGGEYVVSYGREGMPAHQNKVIAKSDIEKAMRDHQPDLRKWN